MDLVPRSAADIMSAQFAEHTAKISAELAEHTAKRSAEFAELRATILAACDSMSITLKGISQGVPAEAQCYSSPGIMLQHQRSVGARLQQQRTEDVTHSPRAGGTLLGIRLPLRLMKDAMSTNKSVPTKCAVY